MCKIIISTFHYYALGVIGVIIFAHSLSFIRFQYGSRSII